LYPSSRLLAPALTLSTASACGRSASCRWRILQVIQLRLKRRVERDGFFHFGDRVGSVVLALIGLRHHLMAARRLRVELDVGLRVQDGVVELVRRNRARRRIE
jgi:hypothetical protein